jgi:hypothetical protein
MDCKETNEKIIKDDDNSSFQEMTIDSDFRFQKNSNQKMAIFYISKFYLIMIKLSINK